MSIKEYQAIRSLLDTPFGYTLSVIGGKWKMIILYWLIEDDIIRYNDLKRKIGTISHKTLSIQLKELEADGIVMKKEYSQIPPKVEYSLSAKGKSLYPLLEAICQWEEKYR